MQHERIWQPDQAAASDNVGDVLASIRRLIAQDQAKLPCGRTVVESQPCASAQTLMSGPELRPPFVLGRNDLLPVQPAPAQPVQATTERDARHLHLASISQTVIPAPSVQDRATAWQPAPIPDWPAPAERPETQAAQTKLAESDDSPDEATKFAEAEAEAALARMTAPRPIAVAQDTTPAAPDAAVFKETQMAQDMRMMEMGRLEDISAIRPVPTAEGLGFGAPQAEARPAPNLFGEIGGMAKDATLRMLIRDAIQTELHGELGARLSRNMCQMIRQEVEAVIREICAES